MTPFLRKRCFLTWLKKWVLLCFSKAVFTENTIFIVFSANTAFQKQKWYVEKNRKFMKNSGLFLNMAKWCFFGFVFCEVLVLLWFVFGVFGIVPGVLKMLIFSQFFGRFWGGFFLCIFGVGRFRCFCGSCVSCVCFWCLCCFCFCFVCFVFVLLLDCFWCSFLVCFCFFFCFFFLYFCSCFFVFVFFCFFLFFVVLFFWRV